jgi:probable H4MPT-linked C1 transfer pathway protein
VETVIGLDIGGANTKAAFVRTKNGSLEEVKTVIKYLPIWKYPENLASILLKLRERISDRASLDAIGLTMTAELSDAFQTKREGVNHIIDCVAQAFGDLPVFVLNVNGKLTRMEDAKLVPIKVAGANWAATGWLVANLIKTCVVIDVGTTSTSIIPVINGNVSPLGKTDLEKLMIGELVYTGSLRTNVATIVNSIPLRTGTARVASELFAQMGDVHLILGNITENKYTTETADGRGKTKREAMARLARVVCADIEMLTQQEIVQMARYIYTRQVDQVAEGLDQVYTRVRKATNSRAPVVITGLGKDFVAKIAAKKVGVDEIIDLSELTRSKAVISSPAVGVALMVASKLEGRLVKWKP